MNRQFLQKKLLEIYHEQVEIEMLEKRREELIAVDIEYAAQYKYLLDKATKLLEKVIENGLES